MTTTTTKTTPPVDKFADLPSNEKKSIDKLNKVLASTCKYGSSSSSRLWVRLGDNLKQVVIDTPRTKLALQYAQAKINATLKNDENPAYIRKLAGFAVFILAYQKLMTKAQREELLAELTDCTSYEKARCLIWEMRLVNTVNATKLLNDGLLIKQNASERAMLAVPAFLKRGKPAIALAINPKCINEKTRIKNKEAIQKQATELGIKLPAGMFLPTIEAPKTDSTALMAEQLSVLEKNTKLLQKYLDKQTKGGKVKPDILEACITAQLRSISLLNQTVKSG